MCIILRHLYFLLLAKFCSMQMIDIQTLENLIRRKDVELTTPSDKDVSAIEAYGKLKDDLMGRLVVKKKIPPSVSRCDVVFLYLEPLQLISVNEVEQSIHLSHITDIRWFDPNMGWDPALYNNISELEISTSSVWTPRLVLPKSTRDGTVTLPDHVTLTSKGLLISYFSGYISSLCNLDLTYFPFDQHKCTIVFMGEGSFKLLPDTSSRHVDVTKHFRDSGEWVLLKQGCVSKHDAIMYVECFVLIQRRSSFYVANLVVPMLFTSAMTLIVFWIPAESGEKISFLVSVFVSTSVFLNYIVETIPRSIENLPHINALLIFVVIKVIVATAATAVVLRRYKDFRFLQQDTHILNGSLYDHQKRRKMEEAMMARVDLPSFVANVYSPSCHAQGFKQEKKLLRVHDEKRTERAPRRGLRNLASWWRRMSHDDLDKLFFSVLLSVSLVAYSALLFI